MRVIYSIGSKFGGHGIGNQALQAVRGIYRARALKKVLASYQSRSSKLRFGDQTLRREVPQKYIRTMGVVGLGLRRLAYYDPTGWAYVLHDNIFDRWAARQIESCNIFHGWNHHCLHQLKAIKGLKGAKGRVVTVVERASSHILHGQEILREEYKKYGIRGSFWPQPYVNKCLKEYEEADFVVVPSDYALQSFVDRGFDASKLVKIPFGVDCNKFKVQNSKFKIAVQSSKFIVLYVGEIRLGKGVQYLLGAWEKLKLDGAELWLAGEVKRDFNGFLKGIKGMKDVKLLGFRRDVAELMGQANVFAFPSLDEGSALVTYEAMAVGVPVITTPNAGSLVRDMVEGYIIPIRDIDALAERIKYFYDYPEQARLMGKNGRERIKDFTWARYGDSLVKAYIKMLK